ncbi:hypothetical protein QJS10_CPB21g01015 [Acorus calamus]|uniref:Uncharacterized protein n=1 Tax=Acorus calamus TaxID=4465 RepID=A0AAV9C628_ACOCL|nr:hypothetical protein QJS10_CPB21g01015 [Acorus calamus]
MYSLPTPLNLMAQHQLSDIMWYSVWTIVISIGSLLNLPMASEGDHPKQDFAVMVYAVTAFATLLMGLGLLSVALSHQNARPSPVVERLMWIALGFEYAMVALQVSLLIMGGF